MTGDRYSDQTSTWESVHTHPRAWLKEDQQVRIELHKLFASIPKQHRLQEEMYLRIHLDLEPYLSWINEAKCFILEGTHAVFLNWPHIESNSIMQWFLPFARIDRPQLKSISPKPIVSDAPRTANLTFNGLGDHADTQEEIKSFQDSTSERESRGISKSRSFRHLLGQRSEDVTQTTKNPEIYIQRV